MKNKKILIFAALSLLFTVWYCQFIFSPSSEMLGVATTDGYQLFAVISKDLQIIQQGHLPFGTFWLSDFYGGSMATFFHVSIIPDIPQSLFLFANFIFDDLVLWLKLFAFFSLLTAQFFAFKFAKFHLKNTSVAWILIFACWGQ